MTPSLLPSQNHFQKVSIIFLCLKFLSFSRRIRYKGNKGKGLIFWPPVSDPSERKM